MKTRGVLPGFGLTMGYTSLYCVLVLLPLSAFSSRWDRWAAEFLSGQHPRTLAAYRLTFAVGARLVSTR
jgi:sulfate transport system permease protein